MAEVKWIKIVTDIFDDEKILLIESMPEADSIIVIWFKLLCLAGKQNNSGVFVMSNGIPYTSEMLTTIFRRKETVVTMALNMFKRFGMIEIIDDAITIPNWGKHQNLDKIEAKNEYQKNYMRDYRARQKLLAEGNNADITNCKTNSRANVSPLDKNKKREDKEEDITVSKDTVCRTDIQRIIDAWNQTGVPEIKKLSASSKRYKMLMARIKEFGIDQVLAAIESIKSSPFLRGQNKNSWIINLDWFVKPNNFPKVLEGNYLDGKKNQSGLEEWLSE